MQLEAKITLDGGEVVDFFVNERGEISRWGNVTKVLGESVDVTERIARAMFRED